MVIEGSVKKTVSATLFNEPARPDTASLKEMNESTKDMESDDWGSVVKEIDITQLRGLLERTVDAQPGLTQRQCLLVVVLAIMSSDATKTSPENVIGATSMILHLVLLQEVQLEDRTFHAPRSDSVFFKAFLNTARAVLSSTYWDKAMKRHNFPCDLFDFIDGRTYFAVQMMIGSVGSRCVVTPALLSPFNTLASLVDRICGTNLAATKKVEGTTGESFSGGQSQQIHCFAQATRENQNFMTVLPFHNSVFDPHLKPVYLEVSGSSDPENDGKASRLFREQRHWHSSKLLDQKKVAALAPRDGLRNQKRNQRYMAEMEKYANSLLGSAGMSQPEVVVARSSKISQQETSQTKRKPYSGPRKSSQPMPGKPTTRELAAATIQQKMVEGEKKQLGKWTSKVQDFAKSKDLVVRFANVEEYLSNLPIDSRARSPHLPT